SCGCCCRMNASLTLRQHRDCELADRVICALVRPLFRMFRLHIACEQIKTCACLCESYFRFKTSNERQPTITATVNLAIAGPGEQRGRHHGGYPDIDAEAANHAGVLRRRDSNHSQWLLVERDRFADELRVRVESSLPEAVADDGHRVLARHKILVG